MCWICVVILVCVCQCSNAFVAPYRERQRRFGLKCASKENIGNVVFLLPSEAVRSKFGEKSPVGCPTLEQAANHLVQKISWFSNGLVHTEVVDKNKSQKTSQLVEANVLIALGLTSERDLAFASQIFASRGSNTKQCHFALDCAKELPSMVGPYVSPSIQSALFPWSDHAAGMRLDKQMRALFGRWTSDDFAVAIVLFLNRFSGSRVDWVKHSIDATWEKGPIRNTVEFIRMVSKCGDCIGNCLADENCRSCIDALNAVDTRDQVASYRTIVSFESKLLRDFSYCILQKNNVFGCDADIPTMPHVEPIRSWRNQPMTTQLARSILVGHLKNEPIAPEGGLGIDVSWKVAAGANVAYDQFPSQNQLFYEGVGRNMWYDPVFRVETIDGRNVWCKRHYTVRDGPVPGTFLLSVLDNGVTSNEFWSIGGVAEDLSWIVFHYKGAASSVGQRYIGGLLCTPDGALPEQQEEVWAALHRVHIQPWELYVVDNDPASPGALDAGQPPLYHFRDKVLALRKKK